MESVASGDTTFERVAVVPVPITAPFKVTLDSVAYCAVILLIEAVEPGAEIEPVTEKLDNEIFAALKLPVNTALFAVMFLLESANKLPESAIPVPKTSNC